jgi:hypothetical protein
MGTVKQQPTFRVQQGVLSNENIFIKVFQNTRICGSYAMAPVSDSLSSSMCRGVYSWRAAAAQAERAACTSQV